MTTQLYEPSDEIVDVETLRSPLTDALTRATSDATPAVRGSITRHAARTAVIEHIRSLQGSFEPIVTSISVPGLSPILTCAGAWRATFDLQSILDGIGSSWLEGRSGTIYVAGAEGPGRDDISFAPMSADVRYHALAATGKRAVREVEYTYEEY